VCVFCASNFLFSSRAPQFSCEIDSNKALEDISPIKPLETKQRGHESFTWIHYVCITVWCGVQKWW